MEVNKESITTKLRPHLTRRIKIHLLRDLEYGPLINIGKPTEEKQLISEKKSHCETFRKGFF